MLNFQKKISRYAKSFKVIGYPSPADSVEHSKTKKILYKNVEAIIFIKL